MQNVKDEPGGLTFRSQMTEFLKALVSADWDRFSNLLGSLRLDRDDLVALLYMIRCRSTDTGRAVRLVAQHYLLGEPLAPPVPVDERAFFNVFAGSGEPLLAADFNLPDRHFNRYAFVPMDDAEAVPPFLGDGMQNMEWSEGCRPAFGLNPLHPDGPRRRLAVLIGLPGSAISEALRSLKQNND